MPAPLRIAIAGAGRMGQRIAARLADSPGLALAGTWRRGEDLGQLAAAADVVIDFSLPEANERVVEAVTRLGKPLVSGVSGLGDGQMAALKAAAATVPVVYDRNMTQGVTLLEAVIREVAGSLGPEFALAIEETHHVHKKDSPSGTALKLGEAVKEVRGDESIVYECRRIGEVPGDHAVIFSSPTETLRFEHSVTSRDVFADGALRAAVWVAGRPPGFYSMRNVLFDK